MKPNTPSLARPSAWRTRTSSIKLGFVVDISVGGNADRTSAPGPRTGGLLDARKVFDEMAAWDVVSLNTAMVAMVRQG